MSSVERIETVGVFLGPYRNLTTLTAGLLSLHPHCQVLNHAGDRVLGKRDLDFLTSGGGADVLARFCAFALEASQGGSRGFAGGSITYSHAFDAPALREAFVARFGDALLKPDVRCLVWKESLAVSRALRRTRTDVARLLERHPSLRFLVPVRHPLDCAASSLEHGHARLLSEELTLEGVLDGVLRELAWARRQASRWPDRVLLFTQADEPGAVLARLAAHLELPADERWLRDAGRCFVVKATRSHDAAALRHYRERVQELFEDDPPFAATLLRFAS